MTITVAATGALTELVMVRLGNPEGARFGEYTFGATFQDQISCGGVTLPRAVTAGWHYGTERWPEGQFIRYTIDNASYS